MLKHVAVALTTLGGICFVVSISLSLSNNHNQLESSKVLLVATAHDHSSTNRHKATTWSTTTDATQESAESSVGRSYDRSLKRKSGKDSSAKTSSKQQYHDAIPDDGNDRSDSSTKKEKVHATGLDKETEEPVKPSEPGESSSKGNSRGKGASKVSKDSKKRRKKESKDPKKRQSKLKTEMRRLPMPTNTPTLRPAPTASPTNGWAPATVQVPQFTLSFGAPRAETEPLSTEYTAVIARTIEFYTAHLTDYFRDTTNMFASIDLQNINRRFRSEDGEQFNILMDFNATISFSFAQNLLSAQELFVILRDAVSPLYILEFVRPVGGTFASVDKVVLGPIIMNGGGP